jgi:mycoredoxin-dependent peroxiredoxin
VPSVGDPAPDFSLRDQHGQQQTLSARRGRRNVLLVFYPFAFTGVCSGELRALSDGAAEWDGFATDVIAVSCDTVPSLRAFADQESLQLVLASDFWPHGEVSRSFDAFDDSLGCAARATYLIDRDGVIRWSVRSAIADPRDITDYVKALAAL